MHMSAQYSKEQYRENSSHNKSKNQYHRKENNQKDNNDPKTGRRTRKGRRRKRRRRRRTTTTQKGVEVLSALERWWMLAVRWAVKHTHTTSDALCITEHIALLLKVSYIIYEHDNIYIYYMYTVYTWYMEIQINTQSLRIQKYEWTSRLDAVCTNLRNKRNNSCQLQSRDFMLW